MEHPPVQIVPLWLLVALAVGGWLCVVVWTEASARWRQGLAVVPYQPRRRVPWGGIDLLLVLAVYVMAQTGMVLLGEAYLGPEITRPPAIQNADQSSAAHLVARLLKEGDVWILLLCGFSAVVVAPIVEEFVFRVLLQGWLEALQRRWRRKMPTLGRLAPGAAGPILISSFLFARMHFRVETPMMNVHFLAYLLVTGAVASVLTMIFAIGLLRCRVEATGADLGWAPDRFLADVGLGLAAFLAIAAPIYLVQITLWLLLPKYLAPDPFALFLLALFLGALYWRTRRIVPAIVVHMSLNATSLAMAWLFIGK